MTSSFTCPHPILLLAFNRPELTSKIFSQIRAVRPPALYFSCDGPRPKKNDEQKVAAVRALTSQVDWPCRIETRFHETNQGCGKCVAGAIEWFFSKEPEGIVLEDDTLPSRDFFRFCSTMLQRYRNDPSIHAVCGSNIFPLELAPVLKGEYSLSKYFFCWGWASWSRCLENYPAPPGGWNARILDSCFTRMNFSQLESDSWKGVVLRAASGQTNTWNYQFNASGWLNNRKFIIPSKNLVTNIGFGSNATHTFDPKSPFAALPTETLPASLQRCPSPRLEEFLDQIRFFHFFNLYWGALGAAEYSRKMEIESARKLAYWESLSKNPSKLVIYVLKTYWIDIKNFLGNSLNPKNK